MCQIVCCELRCVGVNSQNKDSVVLSYKHVQSRGVSPKIQRLLLIVSQWWIHILSDTSSRMNGEARRAISLKG